MVQSNPTLHQAARRADLFFFLGLGARLCSLPATTQRVRNRSKPCAPSRKVVVVAEKHFRDRRAPVVLRGSGNRTEHVAERGPLLFLVQPLAKVYVQPRYIDTHGTLIHASCATRAQFRKSRVLELA